MSGGGRDCAQVFDLAVAQHHRQGALAVVHAPKKKCTFPVIGEPRRNTRSHMVTVPSILPKGDTLTWRAMLAVRYRGRGHGEYSDRLLALRLRGAGSRGRTARFANHE